MIRFTDRADIGGIKVTKDGYLAATARVARTGIQEYRAYELGMPGEGIVKIYRPESEVFSKDAIASLTRVPVTINHPVESVTNENWKDLAVGEVGDEVLRDGEWIVVSPMLKDAEAIKLAKTTHKEISMGYTAELRDAAPETGADYEMYNLRFNHLAMVPKGRAGSQARFGDAEPWGASPINVEDKQMTVELKTVVLNDKAVKVEAQDAEAVTALVKDHKEALAKIGELEVKLADAEAKIVSDEEFQKRVSDAVELKSKRDAVIAKIGDKAKEWSDSQIEGAFLALDAIPEQPAKKSSEMRKAVGDALKIDDAEDRIKTALNKFLHPEVK